MDVLKKGFTNYVQGEYEYAMAKGIEVSSIKEPSKKKRRKPWHHKRG